MPHGLCHGGILHCLSPCVDMWKWPHTLVPCFVLLYTSSSWKCPHPSHASECPSEEKVDEPTQARLPLSSVDVWTFCLQQQPGIASSSSFPHMYVAGFGTPYRITYGSFNEVEIYRSHPNPQICLLINTCIFYSKKFCQNFACEPSGLHAKLQQDFLEVIQ